MGPYHSGDRVRVLVLVLVASFSGCGGGAGATDAPPQVPPVSATCTPEPASTLKVSVKEAPYSAKADGVTDDGPAIQRAVDFIAGKGGGTVSVPAGTYAVDPTRNGNAAVRIGSNVTLSLEPGATLQALPTSTSNCVVLMVNGVQHANIIGGTVIGNRYNNTITDTSEAGVGVQVVNSRHVVVAGVTARACWADGFYVGAGSQDVTLCNVVADDNRRWGLAISSVDGMVLKNSVFRNTSGFLENGAWACGGGVDIEPNIGETVNNVQFLGCAFTANAAEGLAVGPSVANTGKAFVTNILVDGNTASGNGTKEGAAGIEFSNTGGHIIRNNVVSGNIGDGIYLRNQANGNVLSGNTVTGTKAAPSPGDIGYGILLYKTSGNAVNSNTVSASAACGIRDAYPSGPNTIGPNTLNNNGGTCP